MRTPLFLLVIVFLAACNGKAENVSQAAKLPEVFILASSLHPSANLGDQYCGTVKHHRITITNDTGEDVIVEDVKMACTCLAVNFDQQTIINKGSTKVELKLLAPGVDRGTSFPVSFTVSWRGERTGKAFDSVFNFNVKPIALIQIEQEAVGLGIWHYGKKAPASLIRVVRGSADVDFSDLVVSLSNDLLNCEVISEGPNEWLLEVAAVSSNMSGPVLCKIDVRPNCSEGVERGAGVLVSGIIIGPVRPSPSVIDLGRCEIGVPRTVEVVISPSDDLGSEIIERVHVIELSNENKHCKLSCELKRTPEAKAVVAVISCVLDERAIDLSELCQFRLLDANRDQLHLCNVVIKGDVSQTSEQ